MSGITNQNLWNFLIWRFFDRIKHAGQVFSGNNVNVIQVLLQLMTMPFELLKVG